MDTVDGSMYSIEGNQIKRKESEFVANGITSKGSTFIRWITKETTINQFQSSSEIDIDISTEMREKKNWEFFFPFSIAQVYDKQERTTVKPRDSSSPFIFLRNPLLRGRFFCDECLKKADDSKSIERWVILEN